MEEYIRTIPGANMAPPPIGTPWGDRYASLMAGEATASPIVKKAMDEASSQITSAVAQEMVNAVTQTAMKYTGQSSFGQALPQSPSGAYGQRANSMADQMRSSILGSQLPTRSLMPIARPFGRK